MYRPVWIIFQKPVWWFLFYPRLALSWGFIRTQRGCSQGRWLIEINGRELVKNEAAFVFPFFVHEFYQIGHI